MSEDWFEKVVIALVKLKNLKAIHNYHLLKPPEFMVVIALVKLKNLKAIHNHFRFLRLLIVVIALAKLENLKAIHNVCKYLKLY